MPARRRSFNLGDIFEIQADSSLVYAQFVRRDPGGIPIVRVFDKTFKTRPEDLGQLVVQRPRFLAILMSLDSRLLRVIGNVSPPKDARLPVILLSPVFERMDLPPKWRLWDGQNVWDAETREHNGREAPRAQVLSPAYVVDAIKRGFRARDGGWLIELPGEEANASLASATTPRLGGSVSHFVSYPSRSSAETAATRIEGAQTLVRARHDPDEWVLEVSHPAADADEIQARADELGAIARATGGDYEGWESTVLGTNNPTD